MAPLGNNVLPFATTGTARLPWNTSPTFAVSLLSFSVILTCTDVPTGILTFAAAMAEVPSIAHSATAIVDLK
jgi:hypothetical protein